MEPATTSSTELPGFEKVNLDDLPEEMLTVEELESRKKQLWLIKVPYEFDVSKLSGTTVILNGTQELPTKMGDKDAGLRYESRASKYTDNESCPYTVVVPSRNENCLQVAKGFSGHLDIIETVQVPMLVYPPNPPALYTDVPEGLQTRWKPFGYRTPPVIKTKSKVEENGDMETEFTIGEKKKQKRTRETKKGDSIREEETPKKKMKKESEKEDSVTKKGRSKNKIKQEFEMEDSVKERGSSKKKIEKEFEEDSIKEKESPKKKIKKEFEKEVSVKEIGSLKKKIKKEIEEGDGGREKGSPKKKIKESEEQTKISSKDKRKRRKRSS